MVTSDKHNEEGPGLEKRQKLDVDVSITVKLEVEAKNVSAPNLGPNSEKWDTKELIHWLTTKTKTHSSVIESMVAVKIDGDELKTATTKMLSRLGINLK